MGKPKISGSDFGTLILRLALGGIFMAHGIIKLLPSSGGLEGFANVVGGLGIPGPPYGVAVAIVGAEVVGGLLVVLGLFARLGALALAAVMAGAIVFVHLQNGFFLTIMATPQQIGEWPANPAGNKIIPHGVEFNVALLAMSLQVLLGGAGEMALKAKPKKGGGGGGKA